MSKLNIVEETLIKTVLSVESLYKKAVDYFIKLDNEVNDKDIQPRKPVEKVKEDFPVYKAEPALKETTPFIKGKYSEDETILLEKAISENKLIYEHLSKLLNRSETAIKAKVTRMIKSKS